MGRAVNLSPLGLYNWDSSIFDLMQIPEALNKENLIQNLLAETAELEVLYPNPVVFKNLVGIWSVKQLDIWNRLYATTQYEYNPIENYNRYETGSDSGTGRTTHSGTDTTTETTTHGGTDGRTEAITHGGKDTLDMTRRDGGTESDAITRSSEEGGTESEAVTGHTEQGGQDTVDVNTGAGHWIAGYDSVPSGTENDGLVKQTRDQGNSFTTTDYGKTEDSTGSKTTTFGKTVDDTESHTTTFGKTETNKDETTYGKTENVQETKTYGETVNRTGGVTHGEQVATTNEGEHELHAHGNIGVTTTQKLIREQRDIDLFNLYDIIIEDFKMRFCILVY